MRLIGLLRGEGPMTATQAAARLDDNVPNCSFHLRQLAKYGFAERVPGADGRERPWRATTQYTSWDDDSDDPAMREATDQINSVMVALYLQRAQDYLAIRADEPAEWRPPPASATRCCTSPPPSWVRSRDRSTRCWPGTTNGSPTRRSAHPAPAR